MKISDRIMGCAAAAFGVAVTAIVFVCPEKVSKTGTETYCETASGTETAMCSEEEAEITKIAEELEKEAAVPVSSEETPEQTIEQTTEQITEMITETVQVEETEAETVYHSSASVGLDEELQQYIERKCGQEEISYPLVLAVMWVETRWSWHDGDDGRAIGYMQIWPTYWSDFAEGYGYDIYDHCGNIATGIKIIKHLMDKNDGDLYKALQEYNTGDPDKVNGYADLVLDKAAELEELLYD